MIRCFISNHMRTIKLTEEEFNNIVDWYHYRIDESYCIHTAHLIWKKIREQYGTKEEDGNI